MIPRIYRKCERLERERPKQAVCIVIPEDNDADVFLAVQLKSGFADVSVILSAIGEDKRAASFRRDAELLQQRPGGPRVERSRVDERIYALPMLAQNIPDFYRHGEAAQAVSVAS